MDRPDRSDTSTGSGAPKRTFAYTRRRDTAGDLEYLRHHEGVKRQEDRPLPVDEITVALRELATELASALDGVATVAGERSADTGIVEGADVTPSVEGAVAVWWMHSAEDIIVGLGAAPGWELPRTTASVEVVRAVVDAAVGGGVEVGRGRGITTYRVRTPDGLVREDTHEGLVGVLLTMPWKPRLRWERAAAYTGT